MQDSSSTHLQKKIIGEDQGMDRQEERGEIPFPVVAIGASGGGQEAVCSLLDHLSPSLGMAFIIILYTFPDQPDIIEALQRHTPMRVVEARNRLLLEMNKVYFLPAGSYLGIDGNRFVHLPLLRPDKTYHVIDHFLNTMAAVYKNNAFAVILSGAGADGTAGVRAIRAEGGITFAQDDTAAFRGMPQTAVESGFIDFVLPPEEIAARLEAMKDYSFRNGAIMTHLESNKAQLSRICLLLSTRYGIDFSLYKQSAVSRRIIRRMTLNRIPNLETYVKHLEATPGEIDLLYKDLLSGGGGFFREPDLGKILVKKVFPFLLKDRRADDPVRIWLPSCSGGEEACSMAIYLSEYMRTQDLPVPVQIFASDLDEAAIEMARTGFYTRSSVQHISPARIKKFFTRMNGGYQVVKSVRDMCIFASHNFLQDPPFARMDMVCCLHALVSLEEPAQQKALQVFHYALKPQGLLVLGHKDKVIDTHPYFVRTLKDSRIYAKKADLPAVKLAFLPPLAAKAPEHRNVLHALAAGREQTADRIMLSRYVPAGFLLDNEGQVLKFYGFTNPYIRPQAGKATLQLMKIIHEDLAYELHILLQEVKKHGLAACKTGIPVRTAGDAKDVTLEVTPIKQESGTQMLVIIGSYPSGAGKNPQASPDEGRTEPERIRRLEDSLLEAGKQMLAMHEEFDRTREDLQAAHEELLSSNEELQSINEELETSKEELQSTNEELLLLNEELAQRNADFKEAMEYAEAIVETIRQPLLDLYSDLRIRKANKAFYTCFRLHAGEVEGRFLHDAADGLFNIPPLIDTLRQTISKRVPFEDLEIKCTLPSLGARIILCSAMRISGQPGKRARVLLAVEDITERKVRERRKDEFIGIASHELKVPVTSIQAYTQILYNEFVEANDQRSARMVGKLNSQVMRLTNLTRDLLDMTKITQGQLRLKEDFFDLPVLVTEIVEEMQRTTHHRLDFSSRPPLLKFWGDRDRLGQVLRNLISNGIKYSPGADRLVIVLSHSPTRVEISVQDFGIGMAPEVQEKIFDRFFRSDDPSVLDHPGLGLGLYISGEIVRQHGGAIIVRSEKDKGSVFTISLPVKEMFSVV